MTLLEVKALYKQIDEMVACHYAKKKKQPPCGKGCASCCSQFFEVSALEAEVIKAYVSQLTNEQKQAIAARREILQDAFRTHHGDFYNAFFSENATGALDESYYQRPERFEVVLPCVYLERDGSCAIYEARPLTCRTTGVGFTHRWNPGAVCRYIKWGVLTPLWQADLTSLRETIEAVRWDEDASQVPLIFLGDGSVTPL